MELNYTGVAIAAMAFLTIGIFHPVVVKTEYHFGVRPWWIFLIAGVGCIVAAVFTQQLLVSSLLGVVGASCLWTIKELFDQRRRVKKGWFPKNPKRASEYED